MNKQIEDQQAKETFRQRRKRLKEEEKNAPKLIFEDDVG